MANAARRMFIQAWPLPTPTRLKPASQKRQWKATFIAVKEVDNLIVAGGGDNVKVLFNQLN